MDPPTASPVAPAFEFRVPARPKRRSIPSYPQQSPTTSPIKPTSSLARRRRSLISASSAGNMLQRVVTDPGPHVDDDEVMSQAAAIVAEPDEEAREFDSIEQAMTLLSLYPLPEQPQQQAHWPDPEELLKESLRQSLSALRTLREAKSAIRAIDEKGGVFEVEGLFESVLTDLRSGREALGWAEQQMEMEKTSLRERLLKG